MKQKTILLLCGSLFVAGYSHAQRSVFTPVDSGQAANSINFQLQNAFDAQPDISELIDGNTISGSSLGSSSDFGYSNRAGFIDFGSSYSSVQIVELWTAYRNWSSYDGSEPFADIWWSDTTESTRGAVGTYTDLNVNDFNFGTQSPGNTGSVVWTQDYEFSEAVTPERRYLILASGADGFSDSRATEFAIVVVPEPSVFALLSGLSAFCFMALRRRSR